MDIETHKIIDKIAKEMAKACHKRRFGFFDYDDLYQESWIVALQALDEFLPEKGYNLENFLRVVVKNRLTSRFIQVSKLITLPCNRCEFYLKGKKPDCGLFGEEKSFCDKFKNYQLSLASRNSLLNSNHLSDNREQTGSLFDQIAGKEIVELIKDKIPNNLKKDFNRFINHENIGEKKKDKIAKMVLTILNDIQIQRFREKNGVEEFTELTIGGKNAISEKG